MPRICEICSKGSRVGSTISKSKAHTKRRLKVNLHTAKVEGKKKRVCTSCLKKIKKGGVKG